MKKKRKKARAKVCDPALCDECAYIGEGDFVCYLRGVGPDKTVFVMEDWAPTEHYLQCKKETP